MRTFTRIFWIFFTLVAVFIVGAWILAGTVAVKTFSCANDQQCTQEVGHQVGGFLKGIREASE